MSNTRTLGLLTLVAAAMGFPGLAQAQYGGGGGGGGGSAPPSSSTVSRAANPEAAPLVDGGYTTVFGTVERTLSDPHIDNDFGGTLLFGYRAGFYALETGLAYTQGPIKDGNKDVRHESWKLKALLFPFDSLPTLYGVAGLGITRYTRYPIVHTPIEATGSSGFYTGDLAAGLGYMFPIHSGNYEWALRAEALYQIADRFKERQSDFVTDISAPGTFDKVVLNFGLQLPMRHMPPPPPAPEPVKVVEPVDTDGDGVVDTLDQCPGTPAGTKVDEKGCPLPPPLPPCKTPEAGEKLSLQGCNTGDSIVLRGVNFDFDKSRLTPNAKVILDGVADELTAYPGIKVELSGYTDAKGSDEYNQKLSEARAASVVKYLTTKGVDGSRMTSVGYGESHPVADNDTDEGRELNRRVELKVTENTGGPAVSTSTSGEAAPAAPAAVDAAPVDAPPAAEVPAADAPAAEPASN